MLNRERQSMIIDLLNQNKCVQIMDLAEKFNVSVATIRRDLKELEEQQLINRIYGGAVLTESPTLQPFFPRTNHHREEKSSLGAMAASMIREGETIVLDIGTTVLEIAKNIKDKKNLMVFSNSLPVLNELESCRDIQVLSMGGKLQPSMHALTGSIAEQTLNNFYVDKAFIGVAGISIEYGLTNFDQGSAELCAAIIRRARQTILVADSSKFGKTNFAVVGSLDSIHTVITDDGIPEQYRKYFEKSGVELIVVPRIKKSSESNEA